jgi:signal transduction histidine kinase
MLPDSTEAAKGALERLDKVQADLGPLAAAAEAGVLAGLVAHETRNLLTPAVVYAQLALRDGTSVGDIRLALDRALVAMRRACEVSELILAQLREAEEPTLPVASIHDVVGDCVRTLGWDSHEHQFQLALQVDDARVAMPPTALRHVILNLLLNARSALPARGGKIEIRSSRSTGNIHLRITDNGRGIEQTKLAKIQANLRGPATKSMARHAGLGLILCNRLLAASGAELTIDSAEKAGTVATVALKAA